jgi:polysaccharide export outer membrane protein
MRFRATVLLFPFSAFLMIGAGMASAAGSKAETTPSDGPPPTVSLQSRPAVPLSPDYRIGPGDVLRISVWDEPQFTTRAIVRPDGKLSIPLLPDVPVSGMVPDAAQRLLAEQLGRFVKHPRVTVIVEEIHSRIVYVTGEVQHPGAYPLISPLNVVQLIARAGGPTEFAKRKEVYVLHQDGGAKVRVNYQLVLAGKRLEDNISLVPGDTVVVP